jgi:hypothetical protein
LKATSPRKKTKVVQENEDFSASGSGNNGTTKKQKGRQQGTTVQ